MQGGVDENRRDLEFVLAKGADIGQGAGAVIGVMDGALAIDNDHVGLRGFLLEGFVFPPGTADRVKMNGVEPELIEHRQHRLHDGLAAIMVIRPSVVHDDDRAAILVGGDMHAAAFPGIGTRAMENGRVRLRIAE